MKKFFITLALALLGFGMCFSQDIITKIDGEDIEAVVLEVGTTEIKYKNFGNMNGPIYTLEIAEIIMITYDDGERDIFLQQQPVKYSYEPFSTPFQKTPEGIKPNMLYYEYKDLYKTHLYTRHYTDPYNHIVAGVCSYFIPGLGQMICGEIGRGFGYLGGTIGCYAVSVTGIIISAAYFTPTGLVLAIGGVLGCVAVDICSIVDAVKVAKIKNLYTRDMRNMSQISIGFEPYLDVTVIGNNVVMPVGASLIVSF